MLISLIISTRNRCSSLRKCLEYIQRLESPGEWELIVVDNGSTDETPDLLRRFAEQASFRVALVHESKPGLGWARNAGIAKATGDIIAFTDDDCYVSPDFLIKMLEVFRDERIAFMGGRILLFDPTDAAITIRTETHSYIIEPYSFIRAGQLHGANMAMRRSLVTRIGGFDPDFGAGSRFHAGEDTDYQARASNSGAVGIYHPGPLVWHHHGRKLGKAFERLMKGYDYGRGAYYAKFILDSRTRILFLKNWYWLAREKFRERQFIAPFREGLGAIRYVLVKLWG